ncbi:Hsp20/alpha crystallin family protein [Alkalihalobacillus sp. MEB130]|uniref:Hsp20/alpha crystallin family protein n=1 Tax=Alkalihalobacillus sp. MEB130 TaxID=2976704 RepID=UPI0028E0455F|nr:Hsp20/alpha crystallin family protein [Alkalihalobacillus sp. MEB130]MDT8860589.1 Hsp20/alpha crystallin family protein [Alkalihalobacillus sp. MEB130]
MSNQHQPWSKKLPENYQNILKTIDGFFQNTMQQLNDNPLFLAPIPTNVFETNDSFIIEAELPGVSKKQIGLDIYRQTVRIQVTQDERSEYIDDESGITERVGHTQIRQRVIPVPFVIHEQEVKATYKNGLLRIIIPNKRKQISIE